jgi:poly(hydroxyalkanoate) depolymerase family esterase
VSISITKFLKATQLTRHGRLVDAIRLIQRALLDWAPTLPRARSPQPAAKPPLMPNISPKTANPDAGVVDQPVRDIQPQPTPKPPAPADAAAAAPKPVCKEAVEALKAAPMEAPVMPSPRKRVRPASFTEHVFEFEDELYDYRLYVPATTDAFDATAASSMPLVVLLHGCKQDAADFAQGTAMNALAEQKKCLVLYPEQSSKANRMRCWNWFDTAHQARDTGEPGMIAALTRHVLQSHDADPARVYIAGLSAGGAMAAVVAGLYPDLFAAVGVHSGLPAGAATGVMSALSAMRRGARKSGVEGENDAVMPTIVFHGDADKTVHPENGEQIMDAALAALDASGLVLEKIQVDEGSPASSDADADGRAAVRTIYSAAEGTPYVEHWAVGSGPHAWSGGNPAGSFTDPHGPSASQAMLDFFLQHHKQGQGQPAAA